MEKEQIEYVKKLISNNVCIDNLTQENSFFERIVDLAFSILNKNKSDDLEQHAVDGLNELFKVALIFYNLDYQVNNGGFDQWSFNGYSDDIDELIKYSKLAASKRIMDSDKLLQILESVKKLLDNCKVGIEIDCYQCEGVGEIEDGYECDICKGRGKILAYGQEAFSALEDINVLNREFYSIKYIHKLYDEILGTLIL